MVLVILNKVSGSGVSELLHFWIFFCYLHWCPDRGDVQDDIDGTGHEKLIWREKSVLNYYSPLVSLLSF